MIFNKSLDPMAISDCVPDWPSGPLDKFRSQATFDWKQMKMLLEGEDVIRFKAKIWSTFESDPLFARTPWEEVSRDEDRRRTYLRLRKLAEFNFVDEDDYVMNPYLVPAFIASIGQYDWSLCLKRELSTEYFILSAKTGGNQSQEKLIEEIKEARSLGAIIITEMAHGSDTKMLRTKATFDPKTQEFVMNTPDLEATKIWCGVLGQTATHGVVFAQLYTPDGEKHGIHQFLVPLRDPKTLRPYPGLMIGDIGGKIGLNGLDNGFMQFKNYRIPRSGLLNRNADLSPEGVYKSRVKGSDEKKFGKMLGILSCGRVFIILKAVANLQSAITIATRYSACRKQFGPNQEEEWPVIEYQTQQWRLFPYIASSFVLHNFFISIYRDFVDFLIGSFVLESPHEAEMGAELHIVSSCAKAMCGWIARDAIQEGREACGGHGYLKASRFAELRNDHDANNTYEGDNNVLLQQTSNHLLKLYREKVDEGKRIESPFQSFNFLNEMERILETKMTGIRDMDSVLKAYQFLVCWLLKQSAGRLEEQSRIHPDQFMARSQSQVYYLRSLAITFFECNAIQRYTNFLMEAQAPGDIKEVLDQLGLLWSLTSLERHLSILYESRYIPMESPTPMGTPFNPASEIREEILTLCTRIKPNAVALVDTFSPPDFILNSSLGAADGRIYEHIFDALTHNKGAFDTPDWFHDSTDTHPAADNEPSSLASLKAKL